MRNLNLSRLARASESSFFKQEQATQAQNIRKTLTPSEISACKPATTTHHSPDILSEIAAHSAYKTIVRTSLQTAPVKQTQSRILTRISASMTQDNIRTATHTQRTSAVVDASVLRALGPARLSLYHKAATKENSSVSTLSVRPLPGSSRYAEGTILGLVSLSTATAAVASVGLVGLFALWYNPGIVESWRNGTVLFKNVLDRHVGQRMRDAVDRRRAKGSLLSDDTRDRVSAFARSASGLSVAVHEDDDVED